MRKKRIMGVLASAGMLAAVAGSPASADPQPATHVDSVEATPGSTAVSVTGTASFVNAAATVVEDPSGDALIPGAGFDVTTGSISRAVGSNTLVFSLNADMQSAVGGTPGAMYGWGISVDGIDEGLYLSASRVGSGCTNGCWSLIRDNGDNTSTTVASLSGTMANGVVTWNVSMSRLGATTGSTISAGGGGISGTITGGNGIGFCCFAIDTFVGEDYKVPGATVQLGIAPAGTPEMLVPLSESAVVNAATGAFNGSLPRPGESGSYVVVAKACYQADVCGLSSTTITI